MDVYRKIAIACIILLSIFALYKLHVKHQQLQTIRNTPRNKPLENFTIFSNPSSEYQSMISNYSSGVQISTTSNTKLPLKEYCIKSSFHSARSGYYVSTDVLKWVLSRGCRYIDLEVHLDDNAPVVTFDNASNKVLLSDMLSVIAINGFSGPSPNPNDPLFVNLRIIKDDFNSIYNLVGMTIQNVLGTRLYAGNVTGDTTLGDVMGKIVLCCDQIMNPDFLNLHYYTGCQSQYESDSCYALSKFTNIQSGSDILEIFKASTLNGMLINPPIVTTSGISNVNSWKIVEPDDNYMTTNTKSLSFISNYGAQIIPNMFYVTDGQIKHYETFFDQQGTAFVPFSIAIPYAKTY